MSEVGSCKHGEFERMDIYAKVKYNKPWELATVVNEAFQPTNDIEENPAS